MKLFAFLLCLTVLSSNVSPLKHHRDRFFGNSLTEVNSNTADADDSSTTTTVQRQDQNNGLIQRFFGSGIGLFAQSMISMIADVQFPPTPCLAEDGTNWGTCYRRSECRNFGGVQAGSCSAGFGVCCVFMNECDKTTKENSTYFVNPGYPSGYDGSSQCQMTIKKMNPNICQLRLDFEDFSLRQPEAEDHICEDDVFVVSGSSFAIPPICGENTGQHMYVDVGPSSGPTKLTVVTSGHFARHWRIRVVQISCDVSYRGGNSCLQYFTGVSGQIRSFNFHADKGIQLSAQHYTICVRPEEGFCGIMYMACDDNDWPSRSFGITNADNTSLSAIGADHCKNDWITIPCATDNGKYFQSDAAGKIACVDRLCGDVFASYAGVNSPIPVYTYAKPFNIYVNFNDVEISMDQDGPRNKGFCLDYVQQPCMAG